MLKNILRLCLFVSTLLLSACMSNIKSDTPTPANQIQSYSDNSGTEVLSGNWDGLIQTGLDFTYIRLELDKTNSAANASMQSYSGTAYAQSFADYLAKRSLKNDIQAQSTPINIKFDTRTNTFSIQVERGAQARNQRMNTVFPIRELSGIYSQADRALAGLTGSRGFAGKSAVGGQYFLFTRPDQFDKVTDTLKLYAGNFISKKSGLFEMFAAPDKNAINKWAQQLYDEYPQMDLYNMAHGVFELYCIKLMRDDHFEKHFGTRFDELIKLKLDGFNSTLNKLKSSRDRQERSTGVMERMFWVGPGDNSAKQSLFWVKAHRFFINWRKEQLARLGSMPISMESQAYTDAFETEMKKYAETVFWPSEVKADTQALVALRGSIAKFQELEKERLYVSYNKALLDDLAADIKSSTKNFEQMVELSKFDERARNKLRQQGRELQSYTGPSSDTQRKAAEMISAAINSNIVAAAAEFAKKQRGASSISNNLSPIGNGPFSNLAKYITTGNQQAIDQIFYKATSDLVREIVDAESANTKNIVDSNQSDLDKLQFLASQHNEFEKKYDRKILNDPLMLTYLNDHKQQRLKLLNAVEPQVIASIKAANSVSDIKFNLSRHVAQEDRDTEVVHRIKDAQAAHLMKLRAVDYDDGRQARLANNQVAMQTVQATGSVNSVGRDDDDRLFSELPAEPYLNGLYSGDFKSLEEYDKKFASPYKPHKEMLKSTFAPIANLLAKTAGFNLDTAQALDESFDSISLIAPMFAVYLVDYEGRYKSCLENDAVRFEITTTSETIYRNGHGTYLYSIRHPDQVGYIMVNRRFAPVFKQVGLSNPDSPLGKLIEKMFSQHGRIDISDIVSGTRGLMNRYSCDSPIISRLEKNMLIYFQNYMQKSQKVLRALVK